MGASSLVLFASMMLMLCVGVVADDWIIVSDLHRKLTGVDNSTNETNEADTTNETNATSTKNESTNVDNSTSQNDTNEPNVSNINESMDVSTTQVPNVSNASMDESTTQVPNVSNESMDESTTQAPNVSNESMDDSTTQVPNVSNESMDDSTTQVPNVSNESMDDSTTQAPDSTTEAPTTEAPKTEAPDSTTQAPTTKAPTPALTTESPTTEAPTTPAPTTAAPTVAPAPPWSEVKQVKVTGFLIVEVTGITLDSEASLEPIRKAIAKEVGVSVDSVILTVKTGGRRLGEEVRIDYEITLEVNEDAPDVKEKLTNVDEDALGAEIVNALNTAGLGGSVKFVRASAPQVEYELKTTSTAYEFDWNDDAAVMVFEPGKVTFALVLSVMLRPVLW